MSDKYIWYVAALLPLQLALVHIFTFLNLLINTIIVLRKMDLRNSIKVVPLSGSSGLLVQPEVCLTADPGGRERGHMTFAVIDHKIISTVISADSRRALVSCQYWQKYIYCLEGLGLPKKSVCGLTDPLNMSLIVLTGLLITTMV